MICGEVMHAKTQKSLKQDADHSVYDGPLSLQAVIRSVVYDSMSSNVQIQDIRVLAAIACISSH